ncbi:proteoglycan 4-like [Cydia pomonella]|uniref:proteoglycan 4-like n=1 Tax=Cydia pomonella TaxID=82600 RepID=UPI002ADD5503|nr:proteoglycan 4-like [Cydia pomonella]
MVVFKRLLLFLLVFCVKGTYCKPAYDEQAVAPGVWSSLWGWVSYLNPWGSPVDTSASPPRPEHDTNATQIKNALVVEARQFTATTIFDHSTAALKPSSNESVKKEDPTTPITSVQNVQISTTTEQHSLEASSRVITSGQNNPSTSENSAIDSREPITLTSPLAMVQNNPTKTKQSALEHYTEPDRSTTRIPLNQVFLTTHEPAIDDHVESRSSTTPNVLDKGNPITKEEPTTEQLLELEVSTAAIATDQNTSKLTEETMTEQTLELNVATMESDNPTTEEESLETEMSTYVTALSNTTVTEEPGADYPLELEASTTLTETDHISPTSTKQPATEQPVEPEVQPASLEPDTDNPTTIEEPLISAMSTDFAALNTTIVTEKLTTPCSLSELGASTTPIVIYQNIPELTEEHATDKTLVSKLLTPSIAKEPDFSTSKEEPVTEQFLEHEASNNIMSVLNNPSTNALTADDPLVSVTLTKGQTYQNDTIITKETATETTISTQVGGVLSLKLYETSIPTEPVTDLYPGVAELENIEESIKTSEALSGMDKASFLAEPVTDSYPDVAIAVSSRDEVSTERSEGSTLAETVTDLFPDGRTVLGRDEIFTAESKASILTDIATDPYKQLEEVSISTDPASMQSLQVEKALSTRIMEVSTNVNASIPAVNEVEAMFTERDEPAAPRVSRSHSAGYRLSFNQLPFMFLFYAVYFLKA